MLNINRPFGLKPISQPYGSIRLNLYKADTTDNIFKNDPVVLTSDGRVTPALGATLSPILGSAVGFIDANKAGFGTSLEDDPYLPENKDAFVIVADDPNQEFIIQADTGGTNLAETDIGATCDFDWMQTGSGDTTTGVSKAEIDQSSIAADSGGGLQLLGQYDAVDNTTGNWCVWKVRIANHQLGNQQFSIPV